ncbi:MAG: hypothetical protein F7C32_00470 [Desulfurococcales archaeon]|nr:hypothetical protein [Desulfurococcales archaeon]
MERKNLGWYKCDICGRTTVVAECSLRPGFYVCPYCCLACRLRRECEKPVWMPGAKPWKAKDKSIEEEEKQVFIRRRLYRTGR